MWPEKREEVTGAARRFLRLSGDRLRLFSPGEDPIPGVKSMPLPGHTPGQVGFTFTSGDDTLFYTADFGGHEFITLERPEWRFGFDSDAELAKKTRGELVDVLLRNDWRVFAPHFGPLGIGRVVERDSRPTWVPFSR